MYYMKYFIVFIILLFSVQTFACSCNGEIEPITEVAISNYALIFKGKVISIEKVGYQNIVKFKIEELYKGEWKDTIISIETASSEAACGLATSVGQEWLLYAKDDKKGGYWTDTCVRNVTTDEKDYYHYEPKRMNKELHFLEKRK